MAPAIPPARSGAPTCGALLESLDLTSSRQIAFYDDGLGTSSFKPFAILGGAFGFGPKRNVLDIYKFACRNYCSHLDYLALEAATAEKQNREERYGPTRATTSSDSD